MKKLLTIVCIFICALMLFACAEKSEPVVEQPQENNPSDASLSEPKHATIDVYVTFSNAGELILKQEKIIVTDQNDDNKFTAQETFESLHAVKNKEFSVSDGFITKIWSIETSSCGYYINDVSAWSLDDEVKAGDYFTAFIYKDTTYWSDSYSYFTTRTATVVKNEEIILKVRNSGYVPVLDENGNAVKDDNGYDKYVLSVVPTAGAAITIDGEKGSLVTDADGTVKLTFNAAGTYVVSAVSDTVILVPAVCVVTVK